MAMLVYCQSAALATVAETAQVQGRMAPYFLFITAATDRASTARCSQTVQNYTRQVEITSGKAGPA